MRVLFAASEVAPFAKTGGLADVAGALPRALARLGNDVRVVMPRYRSIDPVRYGLRDMGLVLEVPVSSRTERAGVLEGRLDGGDGGPAVPVYFLEAARYYDRDGLYGVAGKDYDDNAERFVFFSRAVVELARQGPFAPDLFHGHDWQTGLVPLYVKRLYAGDPQVGGAASVFTVHNLGYQGLFWHYDMHLTGLGWELFTPEGLEFWGKLSFLKAGLVFADFLTTVSPTYAKEIQTPEMGHGLDGVLQSRADRLVGILNGIDVDEWSPATDPHIARTFTARALAGKKACKADLQQAFGLPVKPMVPLLGVISRLADQKGVDLLAPILPSLVERGAQFVLLGSGDPAYEDLFRAMARRWPEQIGVRIAYDNVLAHKIEAGADMFLMPSRYEPCGLNQMMSLRYGTVPIVRATGGLDDTVVEGEAPPHGAMTWAPVEPADRAPGEPEAPRGGPPRGGPRGGPGEGGNGFRFREPDAAALLGAVDRALARYQDPKAWQALMRRGMAADFSWDASARRYADLYERARQLVGRGAAVGAGRG